MRLDDLRASLAGVTASGTLAGSRAGIDGRLTLGPLDLERLTTLALGPDAWTENDTAPWPTTTFGAPLLPAIPVDLAISASALTVAGQRIGDARFDLGLTSDRLSIAGLEGMLAGGTVAGDLTLSREGTLARLDASVALSDVALANLVPRRDGRPVATGALTATLDADASGYTVADLVNSLSGSGGLTLRSGRFADLDPAPLSLPDTAIDGAQISERVVAHLDAGDLAFTTAEARLDLVNGTLNLRDPAIAPDGALRLVDASIDLAVQRMVSNWQIAAADPGAPPVGLRIGGPFAAPDRTVESAALAAWLNLRDLQRQIEQVEEQNQELAAEADARDAALPAAPAPADRDAAGPAAPNADTSAETPPAGDADEADPTPAPPPGDAATAPQRGAALEPAGRDAIGALLSGLDEPKSPYEARRGARERTSEELRRSAGDAAAPDTANPRPFPMRPEDAPIGAD
nr:AsmA-like C-terminal region-containing protein [Acuticoccus kalidii]